MKNGPQRVWVVTKIVQTTSVYNDFSSFFPHLLDTLELFLFEKGTIAGKMVVQNVYGIEAKWLIYGKANGLPILDNKLLSNIIQSCPSSGQPPYC